MDEFPPQGFTAANPDPVFWHPMRMELRDHFRLTGDALKNWLIAQLQDSAAVGLLWMLGLFIIGVPWAPLWAVLAATLQFIPHIGPVLGLIGPALAATLRWGDW